MMPKVTVEIHGTVHFEVEADSPQEAYEKVRMGLGQVRQVMADDANVHWPHDHDAPHEHGPDCGCEHH